MSAKSNLGWPSFGFFLLLGSHSLLVGLFVWGWQKPALDDAFEILSRRELDDNVVFSPNDVKLLERTWAAHSGFSRALLGKSSVKFLEPTTSGWLARPTAHLVVRPEANRATQFSLEARGAPNDFPIVVKIHGAGLERRFELVSNQPQQVELAPSDLNRPSILELESSAAQGHSSGTPTWAVRVSASSVSSATSASSANTANTARETP